MQKKSKYEPDTTYIVTVKFERKGSEVEELLTKFKTHLYLWVEKKYEVQQSIG